MLPHWSKRFDLNSMYKITILRLFFLSIIVVSAFLMAYFFKQLLLSKSQVYQTQAQQNKVNICESVSKGVPAAIIHNAVANPETIENWNQLDDPSQPEEPNNKRKVWLDLQRASDTYDRYNNLIFKSKCERPANSYELNCQCDQNSTSSSCNNFCSVYGTRGKQCHIWSDCVTTENDTIRVNVSFNQSSLPATSNLIAQLYRDDKNNNRYSLLDTRRIENLSEIANSDYDFVFSNLGLDEKKYKTVVYLDQPGFTQVTYPYAISIEECSGSRRNGDCERQSQPGFSAFQISTDTSFFRLRHCRLLKNYCLYHSSPSTCLIGHCNSEIDDCGTDHNCVPLPYPFIDSTEPGPGWGKCYWPTDQKDCPKPSPTPVKKTADWKILAVIMDPYLKSKKSTYLNYYNFNYSKGKNPKKIIDTVSTVINRSVYNDRRYKVVKYFYSNKFPPLEDNYALDDYETAFIKCAEGKSQGCQELQKHRFDIIKWFNDLGIVSMANNDEIDDVWFTNLPNAPLPEAAMIGPNPFDVNGDPIRYLGLKKNLPIMFFDDSAGPDNALHSFGHRAEFILDHFIGQSLDHWQKPITTWDYFSYHNDTGAPILNRAIEPYGCGTVEIPPNGNSAYDYSNLDEKMSYCDEFYNYKDLTDGIDRKYKSKPINCYLWGCSQMGYLTYWFNHFNPDWWNIIHNLDNTASIINNRLNIFKKNRFSK
ncbi:hypothetical protein A3C23_05965 [Candidatus Roizmanbacteria bacterium RIFCSPHIGHO2_02_FULL_37_13b]|uniref:Uncharacterized protein n=1 Tax=Candidatus Roizmanbacteria bacterium RIFCSPLOWO2_02_FULL_36_11 TaxID=1802071 RepID=A0A1F7JGB7_9BACT|nr:MAG: hypothetical protein A3C23_05965 [Candidatus Roizmanbacteria bacterium RIFCSPHIGHO2_02_FULL_37_13b]OGK54622.1 MAG: hypothetical protein A3H78_01925 [Candidatus Roizmanbacteria bacterium RIFCSPLOWO2_02_FULL_36_11]